MRLRILASLGLLFLLVGCGPTMVSIKGPTGNEFTTFQIDFDCCDKGECYVSWTGATMDRTFTCKSLAKRYQGIGDLDKSLDYYFRNCETCGENGSDDCGTQCEIFSRSLLNKDFLKPNIIVKYREQAERLCRKFNWVDICQVAVDAYSLQPTDLEKASQLRTPYRIMGETWCRNNGPWSFCSKLAEDYLNQEPMDKKIAIKLYSAMCDRGFVEGCRKYEHFGGRVDWEVARSREQSRMGEERESSLERKRNRDLEHKEEMKLIDDAIAQHERDKQETLNTIREVGNGINAGLQRGQEQLNQTQQQINNAWNAQRQQQEDARHYQQEQLDAQRRQQDQYRQQQELQRQQKEQQRVTKLEQDRQYKQQQEQQRKDAEQREADKREKERQEALNKQKQQDDVTWKTDDYKATCWGSDKLYLDSGIQATVVNSNGDPTCEGQYLKIDNHFIYSKLPIWFTYSGNSVTQRLEPGQERIVPFSSGEKGVCYVRVKYPVGVTENR